MRRETGSRGKGEGRLAWTGALIVRSFLAYALHLHANEAAGK